MKIRGADIVVEILKEKNVGTVFGYPGGTVAALYDALYKKRGEIRHIRTAHEQGAAHAADGYARMTGKASVCISTSGPGATNLVTGIATAFMDSTPVVFITGNVPLLQIGTDSFQEVDITGITIPITKYNVMVKDGNELAGELRKAFTIAEEGRKGPVLVDIPKDILEGQWEFEKEQLPKRSSGKNACEARSIDETVIQNTVRLIENAKRPLILAGGGVRISDASKELLKFAELTGGLVSCTMMALGEFPSSHKQYVGNAGMYAGDALKKAVEESDVVIAVGTRFSNKTEFTEKLLKGKTMIHIDRDRAEINKNVPATEYIVGDAGNVLNALNRRLEKDTHKVSAETLKWQEEAHNGSERHFTGKNGSNSKMTMEEAVKTVAKTGGFDTVVTDVGLHQTMTAAFYGFEKHGSFITSGGLGTMGFGMGAAIGAYEATGGRILLITGDGSFGMEMQELATLKRYGIPLTIMIMNNGALGMVKSIQRSRFGRRYSETVIRKDEVSYSKLAKAFGLTAAKATSVKQLEEILEKAKNNTNDDCKGAFIIDCRVK